MTFTNDIGELEVADFAFTKKAVSLFDFRIQGDVSITFDVDNNSINRKVLGYKGPQMLNQVAFTKQAFSRSINGNIVDRGYIVIQGDDGDKLKCFYISGNSNWMNDLIENTTQLDMLKYVSQWDESGVMIDSIENDSGIVYPLADYAYNFQKATSTFYLLPIVDSGGEKFVDFYPCFYLKDLVKEIIYQSGFKLEGDILDDGVYNKMIITPEGPEIKRNAEFVNARSVFAKKLSSQSLAVVGTYYKITFDDIIRTSNLFGSSTYTSDSKYSVQFKLSIKTSVNQAYTVALYIDGVNSATSVFTGVEGQVDFNEIFSTAPAKTFEFYVKVNSGAAANVNANTTIEIVPVEDIIPKYTGVEYVYPNDFIQMKCIDVIKFVVFYWGCKVDFNDYSKTLNISIIDNITTSEDWSKYFNSFKTKYDAKQAKNNFIRFADPTDEALRIYNARYLTGFGEGNLVTNIDSSRNNDLYTIPFQASEARVTINYGQFVLPHIGFVKLTDEGEALTYTTVTDITGNAQFNGTGFDLSILEVLRFVDDNSIYSGYVVVSAASATMVQVAGMLFKGTSTGSFYKQKATFVKGKNRILINNPNYDLDLLGVGDVTSGAVTKHALTVDTTIASGDPEVYTVLFSNSTRTKTIITTGTEIEVGTMGFVDDVTADVTRTGDAEDQVVIDWSRNGGASEHTEIVAAGNPVSETYTFAGTLDGDTFKVTIVEG